MTDAKDNWLTTTKPTRLAISALMSPPIAGMVVSLILALTVFNGGLALPQDPEIPQAGAAGLGFVSGAMTVMAIGFMLGGLIGWPVMLVLGLPAHALLLRKTSAKIGWYALAGGVIGAGGGLARLFQTVATAPANGYLLYMAIGAVTGTLAAVVFWWLRRPDKDAAEYQS